MSGRSAGKRSIIFRRGSEDTGVGHGFWKHSRWSGHLRLEIALVITFYSKEAVIGSRHVWKLSPASIQSIPDIAVFHTVTPKVLAGRAGLSAKYVTFWVPPPSSMPIF